MHRPRHPGPTWGDPRCLINGLRVYAKIGPGAPDQFATPAWQPTLSDNGVAYYQVSAEVAEEWTADEETPDA